MESKDGDRTGFPQTLGAGDAKLAPPQSNVKNEVCSETLCPVCNIVRWSD